MSDSPSTFVPLSLTDTLSKPTRTLHSIHTRPNLGAGARRSSHVSSLSVPNNLCDVAAGGGGGGKMKRMQKERDAMCERLGLKVASTMNEEQEEEDAGEKQLNERRRSTTREEGEDDELRTLRSQVLRLNEENTRLNDRVLMLETKVKQGHVGVGEGGAGGEAGTGGLGAGQLKELEKSFAEQESLLAGYQRDAEKSFVMIEGLKKQARKYTDILARTFGPNYESELGLTVESSAKENIAINKAIAAVTGSTAGLGVGSPSMRNKRGIGMGRMSLVATPTPNRVEGDEVEHAGTTKGDVNETMALARQEMLRGYVEGVQTLLRSVEQRLLTRDYELDMMERRAREGAEQASKKAEAVEGMMQGIVV